MKGQILNQYLGTEILRYAQNDNWRMKMLKNKVIVLGVSGGIAVYKVADMASKLTQAGADVHVVMTKSATEFVNPTTFEALTGNAVVTEMFGSRASHDITHIKLADAADLIVVAPATANIIAKFAGGIADDMLTSIVLATQAPVVVCPAMHNNMYTNAATQENLAKLKQRGFYIVPVAHGRLASGALGYGRLPDINALVGHVELVLGKNGDLKDKRIIVTAGGTQEAIDPVRFIGNRSSGKMGYAVAEAARDRGARVTLIAGPTSLPDPVGVEMIHIQSVLELKDAVVKSIKKTDVLVMTAAAADFLPKTAAVHKIKKTAAGLSLELVKAPDILSAVKDGKFLKVGFKAETQELVDRATEKLYKTNLDLICANDVTKAGSGFGTDTNEITIIDREGKAEHLPLMSKREVADKILDRVVRLLKRK